MARFETVECMWNYVVSEVGKQKLEFEGRRIYAEGRRGCKTGAHSRKTVHLLIKHGGGDGEAMKKDLDISCRQGTVWKGDTQLADWNKKEQKRILMGEAAKFTTKFGNMMEE